MLGTCAPFFSKQRTTGTWYLRGIHFRNKEGECGDKLDVKVAAVLLCPFESRKRRVIATAQ
jgi:hypothetical protein